MRSDDRRRAGFKMFLARNQEKIAYVAPSASSRRTVRRAGSSSVGSPPKRRVIAYRSASEKRWGRTGRGAGFRSGSRASEELGVDEAIVASVRSAGAKSLCTRQRGVRASVQKTPMKSWWFPQEPARQTEHGAEFQSGRVSIQKMVMIGPFAGDAAPGITVQRCRGFRSVGSYASVNDVPFMGTCSGPTVGRTQVEPVSALLEFQATQRPQG